MNNENIFYRWEFIAKIKRSQINKLLKALNISFKIPNIFQRMLFKVKKKENKMIEAKIKEFEDFRKIGDFFDYLGIPMLVTGYADNYIEVDYVDKNGILQSTHFTYEELPLLKKLNN